MPQHLAVAKRAAREAGSLILKRYDTFRRSQTHLKKDHEKVTTTDLAADRLIRGILKKHSPSFSILTEEAGLKKKRGEYEWIVDPLDGTTNFIMKNPLWGVSIALAKGDDIVLGVSYFPMLKKMYWAEAGGGAYCDGKKLHVSSKKGLKDTINATCHGRDADSIRKILKLYGRGMPKGIRFRHFGSAAFELAQVAAGNMDSHTTINLKPWDVATGQLLVREAGGKVTDAAGADWSLRSISCVTSNDLYHNQLLKLVKGL